MHYYSALTFLLLFCVGVNCYGFGRGGRRNYVASRFRNAGHSSYHAYNRGFNSFPRFGGYPAHAYNRGYSRGPVYNTVNYNSGYYGRPYYGRGYYGGYSSGVGVGLATGFVGGLVGGALAGGAISSLSLPYSPYYYPPVYVAQPQTVIQNNVVHAGCESQFVDYLNGLPRYRCLCYMAGENYQLNQCIDYQPARR